jgi:membrane-associated phospholipid phosphatase
MSEIAGQAAALGTVAGVVGEARGEGASAGPTVDVRPATATRPRAAGRLNSNLSAAHRRFWSRAPRPRGVFPALRWLAAAALSLGLILLLMVVADGPTGAMRDRWPHWLAYAASLTTDVGLGGWYIGGSALVLAIVALVDWQQGGRHRLMRLHSWAVTAAFVLASTGLSGLIATIVKRVVGRARPQFFQDYGAYAFDFISPSSGWASFPSGHATTIGAAATAIALLFPSTRLVMIPLAIWLGFTRVVTGVHYPSDVAAGLLFGAAFTVLTAILFARLGYVFVLRGNGLPAPRRSLRYF